MNSAGTSDATPLPMMPPTTPPITPPTTVPVPGKVERMDVPTSVP